MKKTKTTKTPITEGVAHAEGADVRAMWTAAGQEGICNGCHAPGHDPDTGAFDPDFPVLDICVGSVHVRVCNACRVLLLQDLTPRPTPPSRLTAAQRALGWREGTVAELCDLDAQEAGLVEIRGAALAYLQRLYERSGCTQSELAERLGSSQSRVSKLLAFDPTSSFKLIFRAIFALGGTPQELGRLLRPTRSTALDHGSKRP